MPEFQIGAIYTDFLTDERHSRPLIKQKHLFPLGAYLDGSNLFPIDLVSLLSPMHHVFIKTSRRYVDVDM